MLLLFAKEGRRLSGSESTMGAGPVLSMRIPIELANDAPKDLQILSHDDILFKKFASHSFLGNFKFHEDMMIPPPMEQDYSDRSADDWVSITQRILMSSSSDICRNHKLHKIFMFRDEPVNLSVDLDDTVCALGIMGFINSKPLNDHRILRDSYFSTPVRHVVNYQISTSEPSWKSSVQNVLLGDNPMNSLSLLSSSYPQLPISSVLWIGDFLPAEFFLSNLLSKKLLPFLSMRFDFSIFSTIRGITTSLDIATDESFVEAVHFFADKMDLLGLSMYEGHQCDVMANSESELAIDGSDLSLSIVSSHATMIKDAALFPFKPVWRPSVIMGIKNNPVLFLQDFPRYLPIKNPAAIKNNLRSCSTLISLDMKYIAHNQFWNIQASTSNFYPTPLPLEISELYAKGTHFYAFDQPCRRKNIKTGLVIGKSKETRDVNVAIAKLVVHRSDTSTSNLTPASDLISKIAVDHELKQELNQKCANFNVGQYAHILHECTGTTVAECHNVDEGNVPLSYDTQSRVEMFLKTRLSSEVVISRNKSIDLVEAISIPSAKTIDHPSLPALRNQCNKNEFFPESKGDVTTPLLIDDSNSLNGMNLLISEDLLDIYPSLVLELNRLFGLDCIDGPIDAPVQIAVDMFTAITIISADIFDRSDEFRNWMLLMTTAVFKYDCICILVLEDTDFCSRLEEMFKLRLSLMEFPCATCIRYCSAETMPFQVYAICSECAVSCIVKDDCLLTDFIKNTLVLHSISDRLTCIRCEFLQLMPSINLYFAVALLSKWAFRKVLSFTANDVAIIFKAFHRDSIKSRMHLYLQLIHRYCGSVHQNSS